MSVTNKRKVTIEGPDFYPTPVWATKSLLNAEKFNGTILEPCCGNGAISDVLKQNGYSVSSSDLHEYGYGVSGVDAKTISDKFDNVITNPPYNQAEEMLLNFLKISTEKVALLLRLSFLESKKRFPLFVEHPLSRVYVFSERLSLAPYGQTVKGGGTVSYGWFIWDKTYSGPTILNWIPPGLKNKKF